eukprot:138530-Rhodomonas_salina.2
MDTDTSFDYTTRIVLGVICLRACYEISGTDASHGATKRISPTSLPQQNPLLGLSQPLWS